MRILVIGGSSFVGRAIVESALAGGHEVTLFNRGRTDPGAFPQAERLVGDRDHDLSALEGRSFDATVDVCAYVPAQVRSLLDALGDGAGHYTLISTISVYSRDLPETGFTEDAPLLEPAWDDELTMERYGPLKVACEQVARELASDRLLVIRPGYVLGPHDPTHRFTYWVERVAAGGGPIAGPDADQPLQGVDARDLGAFTVAQVERGAVDVIHVTAPDPALTFRAALEVVAEGIGTRLPEMRWGGADQSLPLTAPPEWWPTMRASVARAKAAGFTWRPLGETARDTHAWVSAERAAGRYVPRPGVGPTPEQERDLLARSTA